MLGLKLSLSKGSAIINVASIAANEYEKRILADGGTIYNKKICVFNDIQHLAYVQLLFWNEVESYRERILDDSGVISNSFFCVRKSFISLFTDKPAQFNYLAAGTNNSTITSYDGQMVREIVTEPPYQRITTPNVLNFKLDTFDGVLQKTMSDDVAPYRALDATVGANHGYKCGECAATTHGKTTADIGSIYSKGGEEYIVAGIVDSDTIVIMDRDTNFPPDTGTFTHVSGGVDTDDIVVTSVTTRDLFIPFQNKRLEVKVDGVVYDNTARTFEFTDKVVLTETYEVLPREEVVSWFELNGSSGNFEPTGTASFSVNIKYIFDKYGGAVIDSTFNAIQSMPLQDIMFIQANRLDLGNGNVRYYIPKTLPVTHESVSYDFSRIERVDNLSWSSRLDFTPDDCESTGILADRLIMLNDDYGFAMGYMPLFSAEIDERRNQATVKAMQLSDNQQKVYLSAIDKGNITLDGNEEFRVIAYRNYFKGSSQYTSMYPASDGVYEYLYLDWHTAGTKNIPVPVQYYGKSYTIVEKTSGVTLSNGVFGHELSIPVTLTGFYAYCVLRVTN